MPPKMWTFPFSARIAMLVGFPVRLLVLGDGRPREDDRGWGEWSLALGKWAQPEKIWWQSQGAQEEEVHSFRAMLCMV